MSEKGSEKGWHIDLSILEQGDIYFFYKPRKGLKQVTQFTEVGRFYFVLKPQGEVPARFLVLGAQQFPLLDDKNQTGWGVVQKVGGRGFKVTTKPADRLAASARPVGEGIYALVQHGKHTHFLYSLELPPRLGEVQKAFRLSREANYVMAIKPAPGLVALDGDRLDPSQLQKFSVLTNPQILNYEGTEFLLTAGKKAIDRLGVTASREQETINTADIFAKLQLSKERHPIEPLIEGSWR